MTNIVVADKYNETLLDDEEATKTIFRDFSNVRRRKRERENSRRVVVVQVLTYNFLTITLHDND